MTERCPHCDAQIKNNKLGSNKLLEGYKINAINKFTDKNATAYCQKCGKNLYSTAKKNIWNEINKINEILKVSVKSIPIITAHNPRGWDYKAIGIVTAQMVSGTGVISEFTSEFQDFFGAKSTSYNMKLSKAEEACFSQIRQKTYNLSGNAVIATDIDYSDVGGPRKSMLLVCMAGTAVKLDNVDILGKSQAQKLRKVSKCNELLSNLKSMLPD